MRTIVFCGAKISTFFVLVVCVQIRGRLPSSIARASKQKRSRNVRRSLRRTRCLRVAIGVARNRAQKYLVLVLVTAP